MGWSLILSELQMLHGGNNSTHLINIFIRTYFISTPFEVSALLAPFYKRGNCGTEGLRSSPNVSWLVSSRARVWTQAFGLQSLPETIRCYCLLQSCWGIKWGWYTQQFLVLRKYDIPRRIPCLLSPHWARSHLSWIQIFFTGEMLEWSWQKVLCHLWLGLTNSCPRVLH